MSDELSAKDRAELCLKLAQQAFDRVKSRRDVEWKVAIGLWTLFGVGGSTILTARDWPVRDAGMNTAILWIGVVAAIGSALLFGGVWLQYIAETMRRDQLTTYYWESAVQEAVQRQLPWPLDPKEVGNVANPMWIRVTDAVPDRTADTESKYRQHLAGYHNSQLCQFAITLLFSIFFSISLASRCWGVMPSPVYPSIKFENGQEPGKVR